MKNLICIPVHELESIYACSFYGKDKGSVGVTTLKRALVLGPKKSTDEEVQLSLYSDYEHISGLEVNEVILD